MINIEICKSKRRVGAWSMCIGDIEGSVNISNANKDDILKLISEEMK